LADSLAFHCADRMVSFRVVTSVRITSVAEPARSVVKFLASNDTTMWSPGSTHSASMRCIHQLRGLGKAVIDGFLSS